MRPVDHIVIHCAATPNGKRFTVEQLDAMHAQRGFQRREDWRAKQNAELGSIGYHFVVYTSGTVATGRHLDEIGAHVQGSNARSIGICMVGTDKFTPASWASLAQLVSGLLRQHPRARVCGHRDFSPDQNGDGILQPWEWLKTCPGFDVATWMTGGRKPLVDHLLEVPAANDAAQAPDAA